MPGTIVSFFALRTTYHAGSDTNEVMMLHVERDAAKVIGIGSFVVKD